MPYRNLKKTKIEIGQTQTTLHDAIFLYIKVDDSEMVSVDHPHAKKRFIFLHWTAAVSNI